MQPTRSVIAALLLLISVAARADCTPGQAKVAMLHALQNLAQQQLYATNVSDCGLLRTCAAAEISAAHDRAAAIRALHDADPCVDEVYQFLAGAADKNADAAAKRMGLQ